MSGIEITLLIIGSAVFIVSFFIQGKKKESAEESVIISEEHIKMLVENEMEDARQQISEVVDETINYAMEKTERAMDRVTNEKMLAVNEYSDTVLEEIHKNHEEVVFLYDMLNNKHDVLKEMVGQVSQAAKTVKAAVQEVNQASRSPAEPTPAASVAAVTVEAAGVASPARERPKAVKEVPKAVKENFVPFVPERVYASERVLAQGNYPGEKNSDQLSSEKISLPLQTAADIKENEVKNLPVINSQNKSPIAFERGKAEGRAETAEVEIQFMGNESGVRNNNEIILELHKSGKSNMAIAKELRLGIGEVKLVIDLFEEM